MAACKAVGITFVRYANGYWYPDTAGSNAVRAHEVLEALVHALDFQSIQSYLNASKRRKEVVQSKLASLTGEA